jgi:hypothetical protein
MKLATKVKCVSGSRCCIKCSYIIAYKICCPCTLAEGQFLSAIEKQ